MSLFFISLPLSDKRMFLLWLTWMECFMLIASAKIPAREESISPTCFHEQLPDY